MTRQLGSLALVAALVTFTATACSSPKTLQLAYPTTQSSIPTGTLGVNIQPHAFDGHLYVDKQRVSLAHGDGVGEVIVQKVPIGPHTVRIVNAKGKTRSTANVVVDPGKITTITVRGAGGMTAGGKAAAGIGTALVIVAVAAVALFVWLVSSALDSLSD